MLMEKVEIVNSTYGILLKEFKALVIADLHIGYEAALEKQGIMIPKSQYPKMKESIKRMIEISKPEMLIILGDVKHEFGEATRQEWKEVLDLLDFLQSKSLDVIVVRGNHDNFLIPILKKRGVEIMDPYLKLNDFLLFHGHKEIDLTIFDVDTLITAHEHPAIVIKDDLGVKHKFKCFLRGEVYGKKLIVLPALSPLMSGVEVNVVTKDELLSPILKVCDLSKFTAFVVDEGVYEIPLKEIMF